MSASVLHLVRESDMKTAASLEKVHNPRTHRLDAKEIAPLFGVTIRTLAKMISANEVTVRTRSDSPRLQPQLQKLVVVYDTLGEMMPVDGIAKWMHHPLRSLGGLTAIQLAEEHGVDSLQALVDEMLGGGYG